MTRLTLMVCPHDTADAPERWFRFSQYLNEVLDYTVHFDLALDFKEFHSRFESADLVYANPADAVHLVGDLDFTPLSRASNLSDEVVFVANPDCPNPSLTAFHGKPVVTVVSMLPTQIALRLLKRDGIIPSKVINKDSWPAVMRSVWSNEVPFGFVYKDTFDGLSQKGKDMVTLLQASDERIAFHSVVLSPKAAEHKASLLQAILSMNDTDRGKRVLQELQMEQWVEIETAAFNQMRDLVKETLVVGAAS